jgi:uncharacterized protein YndB with AHSA1/START domain
MGTSENESYAMRRGSELAKAPLQQRFSAHLSAPHEEVFAWITDFPKLPEWMPFMKRAWVDNKDAEAPGKVGAVRMMDAGVGKPTEEVVVAFEPDRLLAYSARDASLMGMYRNHLGILCCEPHSLGGTELTWLSFGTPGPFPMGFLGAQVFNFVLSKSIRNLKRRFPV